MSSEKHHIVPYKTYVIILSVLLFLTFMTVYVASFDLGSFTLFTALAIASVKVILVLLYFMHLKYDDKFIGTTVTLVLLLFVAVMFVLFFDYLFR